MHLHLDPLGGIAGDMFAAAIIDLRPELAAALEAAFHHAGLATYVRVRALQHHDNALTGHRFRVEDLSSAHASTHRTWREIRKLLNRMTLAPAVRERALAIFRLLAQAEGQVHGVPAEDVSFHEVGAWDSIADIVAAAWLIEAMEEADWSCAPVPLGSGRVQSAHGHLPIPAPATALLLEGYPVHQDRIPGERITPTGAAILRHLDPKFSPSRRTLRLGGSGIGFGTKVLESISNVLRVLAFDAVDVALRREQVVIFQFEVDDQSAEDLAVALEHLRAAPGVLDVVQSSVLGKKGRLGCQVQLLVRPDALDEALDRCFTETSTLGIRWQIVERAVLRRETGCVDVGDAKVGIKKANRPGGTLTAKAEMADLAKESGGLAGREELRREAETRALGEKAAPKAEEADEG